MAQISHFTLIDVDSVTCNYSSPCRERLAKGINCNCMVLSAPLQEGGYVNRFTTDSSNMYRKCLREDPNPSPQEDR